MLEFELKIVFLTVAYFAGWFLFEKIFGNLWDICSKKYFVPKPTHVRPTTPSLVTTAPLDQTFRYITGLKSPDWRVRRISCIQLGDKRGTAVVQALIAALDDPKEEVSMAAGEALAKIGDPSAITALQQHLQKLDSNLQGTWERYKAA